MSPAGRNDQEMQARAKRERDSAKPQVIGRSHQEMTNSSSWVNDSNAALLTDLYELTMLEVYFREGMNDTAVFDLFVRRLPENREFLVACGVEPVLHFLENLAFSETSIAYLRSLDTCSSQFLDSLRKLRFTGDVLAMREGTVVFPNEPILEVIAPLPQAQLIETFVMNQVQLATMAASKAARVVRAAGGRTVVDFGLRRMHGTDAGMKAARAFYIAGIDSTSNTLAGHVYGIPVAGTMAHSYIQAFGNEREALRRFLRVYPEAILLVDTYDTLEGVRHVIDIARDMGQEFRASGVRLDSGDLMTLSRQTRQLLDEAGLSRMKIFASSSLDEYEIERLLSNGAPIDGFGVGTLMATSADAPYLDTAYKLVEYAGQPRIKLPEHKSTLPGRKQVFRQAGRDVIALSDETLPGVPLLSKVMANGRRLTPPENLESCRTRCRSEVERFAGRTQVVEISGGLEQLGSTLRKRSF